MIVPAMIVIMFLIFLLNLLIAQLKGAYQAACDDMVGHARLNRAESLSQHGAGPRGCHQGRIGRA